MGMYVVVFSVLCVLTISCQQVPDSEDHVVHYISVFSPIGYHFHYKTRNGVERKETGVVDSNDDLKVDGNYAFYSSDGLKFSNVYQAGTQGFVPKWTYLPPEESDKKSKPNHLLGMKEVPQLTEIDTKTNATTTTSTPSPIDLTPTVTNVTGSKSAVDPPPPPIGGESFIGIQIGSNAIATLAGGGLG
ncbi:uncharacterized protein LOC109604649 isoform X5 [Aethina tumida]|uniref:uncharacterized protein LOC109604649 isoform X5 n=1 Tax=Aethina tumida TaxID=116153 RepID=UPI0021482E5F|nr:uncharacterized protein LOC109604649 isoform X5 [Aethina tumida]